MIGGNHVKKFEVPAIEIVRFSVEDIITDSFPFTPLNGEDEMELTDISKP